MYYMNIATVMVGCGTYITVLNGFSNSSPYHLEYLGVKCQMDLQANM